MEGSILVVDGDPKRALPLVRTLEREGHRVHQARSGREVLEAVGPEHVHVVILSRALPDMDALEVCRALRADGYAHAVMIIGDRDSELDRVFALDSGADDCLTKPFGVAELQARVRALLRRAGQRQEPTGHDSLLSLDREARRAFAGDDEFRLTSKEFDVLMVLEAARGKVVTRPRLLAEVWHAAAWHGSTKTLDVTIGRVRHKLDEAGLRDRIVAVRGIGFRLEHDPEAPEWRPPRTGGC